MARQFTQAAAVRFPSAVDSSQIMWELYGFKVIPNGFFVDEQGILRYAKVGGFDVRDPEDKGAIEKLLAESPSSGAMASSSLKARSLMAGLHQAEEDLKRDPNNIEKRLILAERRFEAKQYAQALADFEAYWDGNPDSTRALLGIAAIHLAEGRREKALEALKQARAVEPDNWIIRKQIWSIEHPEQFYPTIHTDWQKEQIKKEDAGQK